MIIRKSYPTNHKDSKRLNRIAYDVTGMYYDYYSRKQSDGTTLTAEQRIEKVEEFISSHKIKSHELSYLIVHPRLYAHIPVEERKARKSAMYPLSDILSDFIIAPSVDDDNEDVQTYHRREMRWNRKVTLIDFEEELTESTLHYLGHHSPDLSEVVEELDKQRKSDEEKENELLKLLSELQTDQDKLKEFAERHNVPFDKLAEGVADIGSEKVKICKECGNAYVSKSNRQKYCTDQCSKIARSRRDKYRA